MTRRQGPIEGEEAMDSLDMDTMQVKVAEVMGGGRRQQD
jgi:transposase